MRSVSLDPSLSGFGWAVFSDTGGGSLVRCGVWQTKREAEPGKVAADNTRRFHFLAQAVLDVIEAERLYDDVTIYVEGLGVFGDRFTTAIGQGRLLGLVDGIAVALRVPVIEVPTNEVKKIVPVIGKRRKIEKEEVADAVFDLYPDARAMVTEAVVGLTAKQAAAAALNITDAAAVGVAGMRRARFASRLSSGSEW